MKYYKKDIKSNTNKVKQVKDNSLLSFKINFLNVQNISQTKMIQIEDYIDKSKNHTLFCAVETHNNIHKIKTSQNKSI